jgi:hypothetical protein
MDSRSWKPTKIGRSVILLGLLMALPVFLRASDPAVASEGSVEQPINPCRLYGSVAMPRHAAQVFAIDVKANTTQLLGGAIELADLSGLAVHP